jgi:hypothetical protein
MYLGEDRTGQDHTTEELGDALIPGSAAILAADRGGLEARAPRGYRR